MLTLIRLTLKTYTLSVFLCTLLLVLHANFTTAQDNQTLFNLAVDRFNFATMEYVLAADTKKPEAVTLSQKMDSLSFDSNKLKEAIRKVYDSNSRTEDLSVKILRFKDTYNGRKPLDKQLDAVITFIREDRKGKEYLPQLEKGLKTIRDETLENITQPEIIATAAAGRTAALQNETTGNTSASQGAGNSSVFVYILLIVAVTASLVNIWLYMKMSGRMNHFVSRSGVEKVIRRSRDFEVFPMLEKKTAELEKKIGELRQEIDAVSAGKMLSKEMRVAEPVIKKQTEGNANPEPVKKQRDPIAEILESTPGRVVEFQVNKPGAEPPKTQKKYADYPKENGFLLSQLTDSSDRRSIYEITIPPDSDQAQFTIVDNKEIHEYAIQNRERLLKDACDFEISSSQHTRIEVIAPGKLHKNGNALQIHSKAKIKFV